MNDEMKPGPVQMTEVRQHQAQLDRMLVFHLTPSGTEFALKAKDLRHIQRNPENPLRVVVATYVLGPNGPMAYEVEESFGWVLEQYTAALEGRYPNPTLNATEKPPNRINATKVLTKN